MQGLVIDDFFSIAISPKDTKLTKDVIDFDVAQAAYASARLDGSPDKDIRGASSGKVIGGFVDGSAWPPWLLHLKKKVWDELDHTSSMPTTLLFGCLDAIPPWGLDIYCYV